MTHFTTLKPLSSAKLSKIWQNYLILNVNSSIVHIWKISHFISCTWIFINRRDDANWQNEIESFFFPSHIMSLNKCLIFFFETLKSSNERVPKIKSKIKIFSYKHARSLLPKVVNHSLCWTFGLCLSVYPRRNRVYLLIYFF